VASGVTSEDVLMSAVYEVVWSWEVGVGLVTPVTVTVTESPAYISSGVIIVTLSEPPPLTTELATAVNV
jgi:hypothetical protein